MLVTRWCAACAAETDFERFDCADHGADCLELVCVACGLGLELAPILLVAETPAPRVSTAA